MPLALPCAPRPARAANALRVLVALLLAGALLAGLTTPAQADNSPKNYYADYTLTNVDPAGKKIRIDFPAPYPSATHYWVRVSRSRYFTRAHRQYLVPVKYNSVVLPHAARGPRAEYTYTMVGQHIAKGAPQAKRIKYGAAGPMKLPKPYRGPVLGTGWRDRVRWIMPPVPKPVGNTQVRVASLNARDASLDTGARSWMNRRKNAFADLKASKPGVVLLQESGSPIRPGASLTQYRDIQRALGSNWVVAHNGDYRRDIRYTQQGVRVLYRKDLYTKVASGWQTMPHYAYRNRYPTPWVKLRDKKTREVFIVMSTHLMPGNNAQGAKKRTEQTAWLSKYAKGLAKKTPLILGGDFNAPDRTPTDSRQQMYDRGFRDAGFARTRVNFNYPSINSYNGKPVPQDWQTKLDTIMTLNTGGTLRYENHVRQPNQGYASDHFVQSATIVF